MWDAIEAGRGGIEETEDVGDSVLTALLAVLPLTAVAEVSGLDDETIGDSGDSFCFLAAAFATAVTVGDDGAEACRRGGCIWALGNLTPSAGI